MEYLIYISYISLASWLYISFLHGRSFSSDEGLFWKNEIIFEEKLNFNKPLVFTDSICIMIPARNEEKTILKTLNSIKNQNYDNLQVLVIDDNSSDKTRKIVNKFKKGFKNLKLLKGKRLPPGWVGKTWALKQAVDQANKKIFNYYLFVDSDIKFSKNLLKKVIHFSKSENFLMISLMAKLNCNSFWEKMLIPSFIFFFQKLYPFNYVNDKKKNLAAAAGGFIFCKASEFKKENLYNKISNKVIDDCNIAKLLKKNGAIWLGLTNQIKSGRNYKKLKSIWNMVSRTAFEQLNNSLILLFICILGLTIVYLFPLATMVIILLFFQLDLQHLHLVVVNFTSIVLMIRIILPTLNFYGVNKHFALAIPISAILYICMTITSAVNYTLFFGNTWKGRKY